MFEKIGKATWEIPPDYKPGMRVPARIIATQGLLEQMDEGVVEQLTNVATLPGIVDAAWAMPDAHRGYGAPIGAVFATDPQSGGIISPGAIGFDINCGVRLIRTDLTLKEVQPCLEELVDELFTTIPTGVGAQGAIRKLSAAQLREVMRRGMRWCIDQGFGWEEDCQHTEECGAIGGADPDKVSAKALSRGLKQLGTLGSGNHYLEIQVVKKGNICDQTLAEAFGLFPNQITVMIHCGSRGLGHQIATDYLGEFEKAMPKYKINVPDKQLSAVPFTSFEGQSYYAAMAAAANMAFANRQVITHLVREVFAKIFAADAKKGLGMRLVYDVAHNIAKLEKQPSGRQLLIHRKGATRAFAGQPVIIGGSMERGAYLLVGTEEAERKTFGSTAHGSGRTMSRAAARREVRGEELRRRMKQRGIYVRSASMPGLAEEAGKAYKDINAVVEAVTLAGISRPVASFAPIGNIKG